MEEEEGWRPWFVSAATVARTPLPWPWRHAPVVGEKRGAPCALALFGGTTARSSLARSHTAR